MINVSEINTDSWAGFFKRVIIIGAVLSALVGGVIGFSTHYLLP